MYAMSVLPVVSFTRATFRLAELGFLGFAVNSWVTTPFRCGELRSKGDLDLTTFLGTRFARMDWLSVRSVGEVAWKDRDGICGRILGARVGPCAGMLHGVEGFHLFATDGRARVRRAESMVESRK